MTLHQKADFVALSTYPPLENANIGVPALCIPALTLTDGPNGVGNGLTGVTQLPAAIGIAASFNPALARAVGIVEGQEARAKGIAVVQGPELNLARVPEGGRIFETYGEDPVLTGVLGVADVKGIQSTGDLADVKHFTAYTQETARLKLNQDVSARALAELYNAPFKAAIQQGHAASVMCSYGSLNGVNTCSDPYIYTTLRAWGFTGFVRSDLRAVFNVPHALHAGISLLKPASARALVAMVHHHRLRVADLNHAVRAVLVTMFKFGLIARPLKLALNATVATSSHAFVALRAAESSVVLLKNAHSVLPLSRATRTIAVIGVDAAQSPQISGGGSSAVIAPFTITPLSAIRRTMGAHTRVTYRPGGPPRLT
ncbi:MAG: glycoside hydrolase family 3 protein [Acidimicrobiales bacterium]